LELQNSFQLQNLELEQPSHGSSERENNLTKVKLTSKIGKRFIHDLHGSIHVRFADVQHRG
jgi:hypothetical protein